MENSDKIISQCLQEFISIIKPKLIICFDSLDSVVSELVSRTNSEKLQNRYFDTAAEIKVQQNDFILHFTSMFEEVFKLFLESNYNYFTKDKQDNLSIQPETFSLVEDEVLDEILTCSNLVSKTEINCNQNLFALEQRFIKLTNKSSLKSTQIPIFPSVLIEIYKESIKSFNFRRDLDIHFKLVLYIIFDRVILCTLNESYNHINNYLAEEGIIENIYFGVNKTQTSSNTIDCTNETKVNIEIDPIKENAINQVTNENTIVEDFDENYRNIAKALKSKIQKINDAKKNNHTSDSNSNSNQYQSNYLDADNKNNIADINSMIKALSSIQNVNLDTGSFETSDFSKINKSPETIKSDFIQQLTQDNVGNNKINDGDEQSIDLIVLLFKHIIDERNLPDAIQVLLSHLQIPFLKIALQDNSLFSNKSHPARVLLNNLSKSSIGWSRSSDVDNSFINKLEDIASKIINIEKYDDEYFLNLIEEFDVFVEAIKLNLKEIESKTNEKLLKQEKLTQAKTHAANILIEKMTNRQMPLLIKDILLGSWLYIMVLTEIKYSRLSDEYKQRVNFVERLIQYSQFNSKEIISELQIQEINKSYHKGLRLITFNKESIANKLDQLRNTLVKIHQNSDETSVKKVIESQEIMDLAKIQDHELGVVKSVKKEEELDKLNNLIQIDEKYIDIVKTLSEGTWLKFKSAKNTSKRAKLSWVSPITGQYLFVTSDGLKYDNFTAQHIALGISNNSIDIIEEIAVFDSAMISVANQLKISSS